MTLPILRPFGLAGAALMALAFAPVHDAQAEPGVHIQAPANGAKLDAMEQNRVVYKVDPGPRGDHVHLYVDGKEVAILREREGSYPLETLAPGAHELCVKIVNKGHTPIGLQDCVKVAVE